MLIKELIKELQKYDTEQPVYLWDNELQEHITLNGISLYDTNDKQSGANPLSIDIN